MKALSLGRGLEGTGAQQRTEHPNSLLCRSLVENWEATTGLQRLDSPLAAKRWQSGRAESAVRLPALCCRRGPVALSLLQPPPGSLRPCVCVGAASSARVADTMVSVSSRVRLGTSRCARPGCPREPAAPPELGAGAGGSHRGSLEQSRRLACVLGSGVGNAGGRDGGGHCLCSSAEGPPLGIALRLPGLGKGTCG